MGVRRRRVLRQGHRLTIKWLPSLPSIGGKPCPKSAPLEALILLIPLLLFMIIPGVIVGRAASARSMSGWGYGLLAGFFSWLGLLLLLYIDRQPKVAAGRDAVSDATLNRLVKLAELRERGVLTPEEFEVEKAKLLL